MEFSLRIQRTREGPAGAFTEIVEYADCAREVELTTNRFDSPAKLTFTCMETGGDLIHEGSSVELSAGGVRMFKGYVFIVERNKDGEANYTAYDQLRYLKANTSYTFEGMTLSQMIQRIAGDFGLTVGALEDPGYVFPCLLKENESCLDIIFDALAQTIIQTGRIFNFYDKAGELTLTEAKNMSVMTLIGDDSLATDYTYKRDIDSDTYNRIKLVRKNEQTGRTDAYVHEDSQTIGKWGLLQYYDEVDENLNEVQIDEMCRQYLTYYNRVLQTITLEGIGVKEIRAGSIIPVRIGNIGDLTTSRLLLAEKVTHHFESDDHTMTIEVKSFEQLGGVSIV